MTETGTTPIDWIPRAGARVIVHAPKGSAAEASLDGYLNAAEAVAGVLSNSSARPRRRILSTST